MLTPLDLIGWRPVEKDIIDTFKGHDKIVLLFPHTSGFDTIIALLYSMYDKYVKLYKDRFRFIVYEGVYNYPLFHPAFKYLNAIPVPRSGGNSGSLDRIFEHLDQLDKFVLLISPKGSCDRRDWRTGWYNIAKRYDATVAVIGPDYDKQQLCMSGSIYKIGDKTYEEAEKDLQPLFRDIVPHNVSGEIVDIRPHTGTSMYNGNNVFVILFIIALFILAIFITAFRTSKHKEPGHLLEYPYEVMKRNVYPYIKGIGY